MNSATTTIRPGRLGFFRAVVTAQSAAVMAAPITAGLMSTTSAAHAWHSAASFTVTGLALIHLVGTSTSWRKGGPRGPALAAAGFFGLVTAQASFGLAGLVAVHFPLGVLLFGFTTLQLAWVWSVRVDRTVAPA